MATSFQLKWQRLVFGETQQIADARGSLSLLARWPLGLIQLGLLTALAFAGYTEVSEGCDAGDPMRWIGCSSDFWRTHVGALLFATYLVTLVGAWFLYARAKVQQWEFYHQDYRLLAECLRIQYLWGILGTGRDVVEELPATAPSGSGWVASALRALRRRQPLYPAGTDSDASNRTQWVRSAFLEHQIRYHEDVLIGYRKRASRNVKRLSQISGLIFLTTVVVLFVHVTSSATLSSPVLGEMGRHVVIILMLISLATWAALRRAIENYGWEAEAQRGELVLSELRLAARAIDQPPPDPMTRLAQTQVAINRCGRSFAKDQATWHALHRARPIEAVSGG
jgi:hypothetical protein